MNPGEHALLAEVEEVHWWYRALRDVITTCLAGPRIGLPPAPRILDAGCGTGANLKALADFARPSYLGGFDLSDEALEAARHKAPEAELYRSDICDPEIREADLDLVISADVIYIPGAEAALPGLQKLTNALRPGGLFVLNLPAYDWLFSEHDVAIHTKERYTAKAVRELLDSLDLRIELLSYRVCFLFPAAVASRIPTMLRRTKEGLEAKSDFHSRPSRLTNHTLYPIMALENRVIARGVGLPFGSSVFAIGRRR
jgi:SAM-dependent methyltransferase